MKAYRSRESHRRLVRHPVKRDQMRVKIRIQRVTRTETCPVSKPNAVDAVASQRTRFDQRQARRGAKNRLLSREENELRRKRIAVKEKMADEQRRRGEIEIVEGRQVLPERNRTSCTSTGENMTTGKIRKTVMHIETQRRWKRIQRTGSVKGENLCFTGLKSPDPTTNGENETLTGEVVLRECLKERKKICCRSR